MTFLRAHGVSLVATLWLLSLVIGVAPLLVIAIGLPCMFFAIRAYASEVRERIKYGPPGRR